MKKEKRHISIEKKFILGIVIAILVFVVSLYIYNNYLVGHSIKDNIPLFIVGIVVILMFAVSALSALSLIGLLIGEILYNHYAKKSYLKSKEQIKVLPKKFVNVNFKDFNNFSLSEFVSSEDITCSAKLDKNGKVIYSFYLKPKIYETDDYETFLRYFDV